MDVTQSKATYGIHSSSYRTPHKVAVRYGDRSITYKQLVERIKLVTVAASINLEAYERAAIVSANSIEFIELLFGLVDAGITPVTLNPKNSSREIISSLQDSNTRVLFIEKSLYKEEYSLYIDIVIIFGDNFENWLQQYQGQVAKPKDNPVYNIIYASGTTGNPRGICISHKTRIMTSLLMPMDHRCMQHDDVMLVFGSLSYGGGNVPVLATLFNGGTVILASMIHPDYILKTIEQYSVTCLYSLPSITYMLLNSDRIEKYDISSLKSFVSIAAPFNADLKQRALKAFGKIVYDVFASTECGPISTATPAMIETHPTSVGMPVTGCIVVIRKNDGSECQPMEVGEIFCNNLTIFSSYLNSPQPEGFVSVGDLGYKDQDGFIYLVGRKNDMINTSGYNVYPEEVETVINSCPGVIESAVIGLPNEKYGEVVTAYIVGQPTVDFNQYCKDNLAKYKIPKKVIKVESIPKTESGKILRKKLRELL